jgi:hypothetical protein
MNAVVEDSYMARERHTDLQTRHSALSKQP